MTVGAKGDSPGTLYLIKKEVAHTEEPKTLEFDISSGKITADLRAGLGISSATPLKANTGLTGQGMKLVGDFYAGSRLSRIPISPISNLPVIRKYISPRDVLDGKEGRLVIDFAELSEEQAQQVHPEAYQYLLEKVKPVREQNKRKSLKELWWRFAWERPVLRESIHGLTRYFVTLETAKYRFFTAVASDYLWDGSLFAIACDDYYIMGTLSSRIHVTWALAAGGRLEDRPRYNNSRCFDPFPFPDPTPEQKQKIRDLGERLDAHRKQVQANHPGITITGMYNLLEKLRAGEPFTDKDRDYNDRALVSTLKQIHDELDIAVLEAYGWGDLVGLPTPNPSQEGKAQNPLSGGVPAGRGGSLDDLILERLVALNAERAEEERNGTIRWLRPDYQAPDQSPLAQSGRGAGGEGQQQVLTGVAAPEETVIAPVEQQKFPTTFKDQLAAIRDLMRTQGGEWTVAQVKAQFKNASRKQRAIQDCLDCLTDLGAIACHTEDGTPRWYIAELQKAS
jgi:hypothetical protein